MIDVFCQQKMRYSTGDARLNTSSLSRWTYPCSEKEQFKHKVFHNWYQWVPFYFMAVAVAYYIPYLLLKATS